ncbi:UNVERIFIED_CONTAM: hypothetical protein FKN15_038283 [Acipenser sinensis]
MKMGGEVRRPAPPAAVSLQEIRWPEPQKRELLATESRGEGQETTPTGCRMASSLLWPEDPACVRSAWPLQLLAWEEDLPPWPPALAHCCPCSWARTMNRDLGD